MEKNLNERILEILKEDARKSAKTIASMLNSTEQEVKKAIVKMEEDGSIVKYITIVNDEAFEDEAIEALIELKVTPQITKGFDAIAEDLLQFEQVTDLYLMSGGYDLCVTVKGRTLRDVANFVAEELSTMPNVLSTRTTFVLKKYKKDGVIINAKEHERMKIQLWCMENI